MRAALQESKNLRTKSSPPALAEIIELVNLLPAEMEIPYIVADMPLEAKFSAMRDAFKEIAQCLSDFSEKYVNRKRLKPEIDVQNVEGRFKQFEKYILESFGDDTSFKSLGKKKNLKKISEAIFKYESYYMLRMNLNNIIGVRDRILGSEPISVYRTVHFVIDEKGKLNLQIDSLLNALDGIEFERLGKCEVCRRIFWIGRKGITCCSHRCGNVLNNRRARNEYKENPFAYKKRKISEQDKRARNV